MRDYKYKLRRASLPRKAHGVGDANPGPGHPHSLPENERRAPEYVGAAHARGTTSVDLHPHSEGEAIDARD